MQAGNKEQPFNGLREDQDFWVRCKLLAKRKCASLSGFRTFWHFFFKKEKRKGEKSKRKERKEKEKKHKKRT